MSEGPLLSQTDDLNYRPIDTRGTCSAERDLIVTARLSSHLSGTPSYSGGAVRVNEPHIRTFDELRGLAVTFQQPSGMRSVQ